MQRRTELHARLEQLARDRLTLQQTITDIEASQAASIADLGDAWTPPLNWRETKQALADVEATERMINSGLGPLDEQIDLAMSEAREAIEQALNRLRRPLVAIVQRAMVSMVEANAQLHSIEAKSNRLLGYARYHLTDGTLQQRLQLVERTAALLDAVGDGPHAA